MLTRRFVVTACLMFLVLSSVPASAQVLLAGNWIPYRTHEDEQDRGPGPDLGDYHRPADQQRRAALRRQLGCLAPDAAGAPVPRARGALHLPRPANLRIWEEKDPETQQVDRDQELHQHLRADAHDLDGRPPASVTVRAAHVHGFLHRHVGGQLSTVTTTHLKQGWLRRNGVPESDQTTLYERFMRHDRNMTHIAIITDPVYLPSR